MSLTVSPLAPAGKPHLPALAGVRLAVIEAGLRYHGRPDLLLVALPAGTAVAGVFTKSTTAGAPVVWCRDHLAGGVARGLVVNAGNANVFNGEAGRAAVETSATAAARHGCSIARRRKCSWLRPG